MVSRLREFTQRPHAPFRQRKEYKMKSVFAPSYSTLIGSLSLAALSLAFSAEQSHAVVLVNYQFDGASLAPTSSDPNVSATNINFGSGASQVPIAGVLPVNVAANDADTALTTNSFFQFAVTPTPGIFRLNLETLTLTAGVINANLSSSNGYFVRSSIDSFNANLASGFFTSEVNNISVDLSDSSFQGIDSSSPLTFRVYSYLGSGSNPVASYDDLTLNGTATPVPFESDTLPVVGATLFMAGGLWWKQKRNQGKVAQLLEKQ
ncbi:hypothetical protein IQ218_15040 [Synechocystis salina LEGE 06099]|uniref:hypothetical protein n=1 Tax=Synechocystis salina TaxID=945780 RepID=UPI001881A3D2|nr:hypothetical protein [Synechocystis salina]MBE9204516.1 hypothetical protein [Synechocystis salina LEGE 06099]